jgi:Tfp pilus assembly protein PilN|tara:strand:- start:32459 stop:33868 length:1410 start_codon:yes stop_codon:yes gene_type:complete
MNLPFIEQRVISAEIIDGQLLWVELSKLGSRIKVIQTGELPWEASFQEREETLSGLKKQIQGDIYSVTLSYSKLLKQVISEEVPFFESPEEVEHWIKNRKDELFRESVGEVLISDHLVDIDEDVRRVIFQLVDKELAGRSEQLFRSAELPINHLYTGATEFGHCHILNPEVAEGFHSVLHKKERKCFLLSFKEGMLQQVSAFADTEDVGNSYCLDQAHGFIQSEELTHQLETGSTTLFIPDVLNSSEYSKRSVQTITPHDGRKEFDELPQKYSTAIGAGIKSLYPGLDQFECISDDTKALANETHDKLTFRKTAVLLVAPLALFFLGSYVWNSVVEYQLQETSQVMEAIDDKLSIVQQQRTEVQALFSVYKEFQGVTGRETNTAKVFTALNQTIREKITLDKLTLSMSSEPSKAQVILTGTAEEETAISSFMKRLSSHPWIKNPILLSSSLSKDGQGTEFSIEIEAIVE